MSSYTLHKISMEIKNSIEGADISDLDGIEWIRYYNGRLNGLKEAKEIIDRYITEENENK